VRAILHELPKWEARETELLREMAATLRSPAELDLDKIAALRGLIGDAELQSFMRVLVAGLVERFGVEHLDELEALMAHAAEVVQPVNMIDEVPALPPAEERSRRTAGP
jgi:hypothetical protein